jgi:uncharacterized glyoxalase superfamily protein PhnB
MTKTPTIKPRESIVLVEDFDALVAWYCDALGFAVTSIFEDGFHFANLTTETGIRLGIGSTKEMGVVPRDRASATVLLQIETEDVRVFLDHVAATGGTVSMPAMHNPKDDFWFGGFTDPEGNPWWVVDKNCP